MTFFSSEKLTELLLESSGQPFFAYFDEFGRGFLAKGIVGDPERSPIQVLAPAAAKRSPDNGHPDWTAFDRTSWRFGEVEHGELQLRPYERPVLAFSPKWHRNQDGWTALCTKLLDTIKSGALKKAVPCRWRSSPLEGLAPGAFASALASVFSEARIPGVHRFLLRSRDSVFFGFTPELLYERKIRKIYVPAIAGTRKIASGEQDATRDLLESTKDGTEHEWVVSGILQDLKTLGLSPQISVPRTTVKAGNLIHLYTLISADDPGPEALPAEALINALHPTAAIGGYPKKSASDFLKTNEGWDRGLFSSPMAISTGDREFCLVAIRSALVKGTTFWQFAGAGFVEESDPSSEWRETEQKMDSVSRFFFGVTDGI